MPSKRGVEKRSRARESRKSRSSEPAKISGFQGKIEETMALLAHIWCFL
jgi:hypothetical protein